MRVAFRHTARRSISAPGRNRRRLTRPVFDRLESRALLSTTIVNLGDLGGGDSTARAINNLGQVVGDSMTTGGEDHAFLYSDGVMTDLGSPGVASQADAINDPGQVAGDMTTGDITHAFRYSDGTMMDLGTLGGGASQVTAINQSGEVVGYSWRADNVVNGVHQHERGHHDRSGGTGHRQPGEQPGRFC